MDRLVAGRLVEVLETWYAQHQHTQAMMTTRPTLLELERRCQKPDHRRVGNWMARRVARPLALRVTWVVLPWAPSAHAVTIWAWCCGVAGAAVIGCGGLWCWLIGCGLLQLWYLLDHVDGQLARLQRTASLDGTQLDYLMHHMVNLVIPIGVGWGLSRPNEPYWRLAGLVGGVALLAIGLQHDARYKAFVQRLKRLQGELSVVGGAGRQSAAAATTRGWHRRAFWLLRKFCEVHVVMNCLSAVGLIWLAIPEAGRAIAQAYLVAMTVAALLVAIATLVRSQHRQDAEREFSSWFRVPEGCELQFVDGVWIVSTSS